MDHLGEFFLVALSNADTKILTTVPLFSDIHLVYPFVKQCKYYHNRADGSVQGQEITIVHVNEPETLFINLLNMGRSSAPTEFANKVFAN